MKGQRTGKEMKVSLQMTSLCTMKISKNLQIYFLDLQKVNKVS